MWPITRSKYKYDTYIETWQNTLLIALNEMTWAVISKKAENVKTLHMYKHTNKIKK